MAIGLVAVTTRFYNLAGRSLWLDEITTAQAAHAASPAEVIAQSQAYSIQVPLFYLVTWLLRPWGDGEFILRLPAAVAGVLLVFAVYLVGRSLFGLRIGLVAAVLTAVMPYTVWYSQEARNYSLLMLLTTLQMYFVFAAVTRSRWTDWLGLAVVTTLNLYTHYLAFLPTAAIMIYVAVSLGVDLLRRTHNRVRAVAVGVVVLAGSVAAFVPWRAVLRTVYRYAFEIVAWARLHRIAAIATVLAVAALLVLMGVMLRSRTRMTKLAATALLTVALVLMLLALKFVPLTSVPANALLLYAAALGVVAAALAVAAALLVLDRLRPTVAVERKLGQALAAGAFVAAGYAPWLPSLRLALQRPDITVGRLHLDHPLTIADVTGLLSRLGISGVVLVAFCLGIVLLGAWLFRGRVQPASLLLLCLVVPVAIFLRAAGTGLVAVDIRYLAVVMPSALLITAIGVEAVALSVEPAVRRLRRSPRPNLRLATLAPSLAVVGLLLAQVLPALAASYQTPKEDYRGAAQHIAAASPPGSVLLAVGAYSDWAVICFEYYLRELHSSVTVVDGLKVTRDTAATLATGSGIAWGVVIFPSADQAAFIRSATDVKTDFVDVTGIIHVVRPAASGLASEKQARAVLQWEAPLEPKLSASVKLLDLLAGRAQAGPNLVPDPAVGGQVASGWSLGPGVSVAGGSVVMRATATRSQVNAEFTMPLTAPGDYVVGFDCRNDGLTGSQTVDAVPLDASGHGLPTFPGASPYQCPHMNSWTRAYFAISLPSQTAGIALMLGVQGSGAVEFRALQLGLMQDAP